MDRSNIQGTFRTYSGNIQVELTGEPPSQLQEALKKSTKVDAKYNLPTRVPKTRVNKTKRRIPGIGLRVHHVLPRGPHSTSIIIIINWRCAKNRHEVGLCVCIFIGYASPQK
jgi:hypothetical protein